jgi:HPt (histidine-containing phosphotransfer) domain-containing protein
MKKELSYFDQCFKEMREMFNLPDEVFFELNDAFFDIASEQIELLRTALLQKNMEQLLLHSHTLKGSSASLRHLTISNASAEIEHYTKVNESFDYATAIYTLSENLAILRSQYLNWKPHHQPTHS